MNSETNLVLFILRRTGANLLFTADTIPGGAYSFNMQGLQPQRLRFQKDALDSLERVGLGHWSEFPPDGIQATITRDQLRLMGFRGNY